MVNGRVQYDEQFAPLFLTLEFLLKRNVGEVQYLAVFVGEGQFQAVYYNSQIHLTVHTVAVIEGLLQL